MNRQSPVVVHYRTRTVTGDGFNHGIHQNHKFFFVSAARIHRERNAETQLRRQEHLIPALTRRDKHEPAIYSFQINRLSQFYVNVKKNPEFDEKRIFKKLIHSDAIT